MVKFVFKGQSHLKVTYVTYVPKIIQFFQSILNEHPFHVDSLLQLSDICKMGEDLQVIISHMNENRRILSDNNNNFKNNLFDPRRISQICSNL